MAVMEARRVRGKRTGKETGEERVSKARASKERVEMVHVEVARVRGVEKKAVAGRKSNTAPFVKALEKAKAASPHTMQARV
jgi:hypothetical protein